MLWLEQAKNKFKPLGAIVTEHNLQSLILDSICQGKIEAILLTLHKQMMKTIFKVVFVNISLQIWIFDLYIWLLVCVVDTISFS